MQTAKMSGFGDFISKLFEQETVKQPRFQHRPHVMSICCSFSFLLRSVRNWILICDFCFIFIFLPTSLFLHRCLRHPSALPRSFCLLFFPIPLNLSHSVNKCSDTTPFRAWGC